MPVFVAKSHYPIQVKLWKVALNDSVRKGQEVGVYEYLEDDEHKLGTITSQFEGKITFLERKDSILEPKYRLINGSQPLVLVLESCSHSVQLHGLCAICGKDLTIGDHTGSDTTRATINMTHDSKGVKISHKEATRIEKKHVDRLLKVKKLSLLLDLDQTVVRMLKLI